MEKCARTHKDFFKYFAPPPYLLEEKEENCAPTHKQENKLRPSFLKKEKEEKCASTYKETN